MTTADWLLLSVVALAVIGALLYMRRQKKRGRGCCGNCHSCSKSCKRS